jgi:hypothetical protein
MNALVHQEAIIRIAHWMLGGDTGVSSKSMAAIAIGVEKGDVFGYDAPHDPSDFGRCYRLVLCAPEVIDAFPAITKKVPAFAGILANWDELCELYERDLSTGRSEDLYNRIKELRGDSYRIIRRAA